MSGSHGPFPWWLPVARRPGRRVLLGLILVLGGLLLSQAARPAAGAVTPLPAVPPDGRFGIVHISYADGGSPLRQTSPAVWYGQAVEAGARWNRWALYWTDVERAEGQFDYSRVWATVRADRERGLEIDAVLLGTPGFYATAGTLAVAAPRLTDRRAALAVQGGDLSVLRSPVSAASSPPRNLYAPIFADGTDSYAPGKLPNPSNPWARFVWRTVSEFKDHIKHWEIWNEPDFSLFWSGSVADYVRLLKVGALAARAADPQARILVGGMMYWEWANRTGTEHAWLRAFLDELARDPEAPRYGYYFDIIPWHFYSRPSDLYDRIRSAQALLAQRGVAGKTLWVNETNAPACGEPPAFVSCSDPNYKGAATLEEQAAFVIQAFAYGLAAGLERVFVFQHYDDGNGEAFGLFRNDGSPRPAYVAYQVAARYFGGFFAVSRQPLGTVERIIFGTPQGKVTVVWSRTDSPATVSLPAVTTTARVVEPDGTSQTVTAQNGLYTLTLAPATNNRSFTGDPRDFIIGGRPRLLVEEPPPDSQPPTSRVLPLPAQTTSPFTVRWSGEDPGGWGVMDYDVEYQDLTAGTGWQRWLTATPATAATFSGQTGHTYRFRVRARDFRNNLEPWPPDPGDAETTVVGALPPSTAGGLIQNGGFEGDPALLDQTWRRSGAMPPVLTDVAFRGSRALRLGVLTATEFRADVGAGGNATVEQRLSLPATPPSLWLEFFYRLTTEETDSTCARDRFEIIVIDEATNGRTYLPPTPLCRPTAGWQRQRVDLGAFRGRTVRLIFNLWQSDSERLTQVYLDEVSLWPYVLRLPLLFR